jgi:hypothetical protein
LEISSERAWGFCALLVLCGPAAADRVHHYTISVDPELTVLTARACFVQPAPAQLVAESLDAAAALMEARIDGARRALEPNGNELRLKDLPPDACLAYSVNLRKGGGRHDKSGNRNRLIGRDLMTSVGLWFWRPEQLAADEDIEVKFELPEGMSVSAPWQPLRLSAGQSVFRVGPSPYDWPATVVFGRFHEREFSVAGARLRLSVLDGSPPADGEQMQAWLADAAEMVAELHGRFPVSQAQVIVAPGARGDEPTPWAYVVRGGAPAAHFFVNQRRPIQEYYDDWTAVHEMSHLLLPYVAPEDVWLAEGVATYYQNVFRARAGRMNAQEAWEKLHAGFRRGREGASGMTLAQATESMYRGGHYMRVYWEGTALMLLADVRLRQLTGNKQSLDTALNGLAECCLPSNESWSAQRVFAKLDQLTGTTVFADLYDNYVPSRDFPDLGFAYRQLGLISRDGGRMEFLGDAPFAGLRDAIMGPRPAGAMALHLY